MFQTLKLRADSAADIQRAASILRNGGTVAFPTETVYGLGANALDSQAVSRIFAAKQRPAWDPLIVHIPSEDILPQLTSTSGETSRRVAALSGAFWPGPLTLLLPRLQEIPDVVTAGRALVGVRMPAHAAAGALLRAAGVPLAAPSANRFGHTSPTTAQHVLDDLDGRIDAVLDGGPTSVGLESTVLDPTQTPMVLYRPGAVTPDQLHAITGIQVTVFDRAFVTVGTAPEALPSPGVGIRHYAPRATLVLVEGREAALRAAVADCGSKDGVLLPASWTVSTAALVEQWAQWDRPFDLAARLFAGLRKLDDRGATRIFCPLPLSGGLNDATRDRLQKAARTS